VKEDSTVKANAAGWDRIVRVILGIFLLYLGFSGVTSGAVAIVLDVAGVVFLATGIVGWCPLYALLHIGTKAQAA
jgi:hypothetical protein